VFFLGYVVPIYDLDQASINFGARQIVDYGFSIGIGPGRNKGITLAHGNTSVERVAESARLAHRAIVEL
jgi:hypothetical protein